MTTKEICSAAKANAHYINNASTAAKNKLLADIAVGLIADTGKIVAANKIDVEAARANGMPEPMIDRLSLDSDRISKIAEAVRYVASLPDPVQQVVGGGTFESGISVTKVRVPLGVIGVIFESRPNVCVDAAVLCLKAGNAAVLRGGKEAFNSNRALAEIMISAIKANGFPAETVSLVSDITRDSVTDLKQARGLLDLLIPRGGGGLIKAVTTASDVPVIETGEGNCHVYVDGSCSLNMAVNIIENAKTSRPGVCNSIESLLVHKDIAETALPLIKERLDKHNVIWHGDEETRKYIDAIPATEEDWGTEYLDYEISCKIVGSVAEAIKHINKYSTHHSEAIITNDFANAEKFTREVDSAAVYVNASTRFTDGGEFGLGAEIGIATGKLHARGPMGLTELTTIKYVIKGNGEIR